MKQIACYILTILILFSLAGCAQTQSFQEPDTDFSTVSETTAPVETAVPVATTTPVVTAAPIITKTPAEASPTSKPIPTTTVHAFDVNCVKMQDTPGSSCFSEVGYDSVWEVLVVQFRNSGSVYTYSNFPECEWDEFIAADSLGRWYNKYIKDNYECEKIN